MYKIDINSYLASIIPNLNETQKKDEAILLFRNLVFKLEKNLYHYNNINRILENSTKKDNFFEKMPIYFEMESLFVSFRSTIDMLMHVLNYILDLKIANKDVSLFFFFLSNIPENFKNISKSYVSKFNNPIWEFIYSFRNDIVHERSIFQVLPIRFKEIGEYHYIYCIFQDKEKDLMDLFKECFKFLDQYISRNLNMLEITIKKA